MSVGTGELISLHLVSLVQLPSMHKYIVQFVTSSMHHAVASSQEKLQTTILLVQTAMAIVWHAISSYVAGTVRQHHTMDGKEKKCFSHGGRNLAKLIHEDEILSRPESSS